MRLSEFSPNHQLWHQALLDQQTSWPQTLIFRRLGLSHHKLACSLQLLSECNTAVFLQCFSPRSRAVMSVSQPLVFTELDNQF